MQVRDIMRREVVTISGDETIAVAARRMRDANVGCLVVTNAGSVIGIITDRDLTVRCLSNGDIAQECWVRQHMSSPVVTATPDMDILDAAHLMTERQVKRLPVMEERELVGLVSFSDVALALDRPMHDLLLGFGGARRVAS